MRKLDTAVAKMVSANEKEQDVVIIGGGPGGISAAIWCSDLGLRSVLLERSDEAGGQLHSIYGQITNYPGRETANGHDLAELFSDQANRAGATLKLSVAARAIYSDRLSVELADGSVMGAGTIILATGVSRRRLNVPGEAEFLGRGVLRSGIGERGYVKHKHVVIVGGGDAAFENAILLAEFADSITIVHRRELFNARIEFREAVERHNKIEVLTGYSVIKIGGNERVETVQLVHNTTGEKSLIGAEAVLIRIGVEPNSELLKGHAQLDDGGYVVVDNGCMTTFPGIFAVGDVACPVAPTIATAVGMGATAAKASAAWFRRRFVV